VFLAAHPLALLVALSWVVRVMDAWRGLPSVPDLRRELHDLTPAGESLTVVVPARNEEQAIGECLRSLIDQDYDDLRILAVDDRSTDGTGAIMDALAAAHPRRLRVSHIVELPAGWLGKTHAMAVAAESCDSSWLLFTDGDVLFQADALRRSLAYALASRADHLVVAPTTIIRRWDEAGLLSFFQIFGLWAARPWKVADPRARDAIGIGAFNLIRRGAYEQIGGFGALRMAVIEDLGLARRVKAAGLRQRIAFGRDLVRVHWAAGVDGLIRTMTKNIFAAFRFRPELLLIGCAWLAVFCVGPFVMVWVPGFRAASAVAIAAIAVSYRLMGRRSGHSVWNVLLAPFAASLFIYALLRSMAVTLWQGGIVWRGTFYSLRELRRNMPDR
jgi:glycosyltransferase involved in cell wall biosynthesis